MLRAVAWFVSCACILVASPARAQADDFTALTSTGASASGVGPGARRDGEPGAPGERRSVPTRVFRRRVTTKDGVALALYRYVPVGGGQRKAPVLLVPDFGMNRAVFDVHGEGLAPWLRAQGREVFVLEQRGHGASAAPATAKLSDLVQFDLPAAVDAIRARRQGPVDLVVHGYAGTLAIAATGQELRGKVRRVVAIATPGIVELPNRHAEELLRGGGRLADLTLSPEGAATLDLLFTRHGKFERRTLAALRRTAFENLSPNVAAELLDWMKTGDRVLGGDGDTVRARLAAYDRPTLQLHGLRDNWVHVESGTPLREVATRARVTLRVLSYVYLLAEDYTHVSILHGEAAGREVFPLIEAFLEGEEVPDVVRPGSNTATEATP